MPVPGPDASWREKQHYNKVMEDITEGTYKNIRPKDASLLNTEPRNIYEENLARNEEYGEEPLAAGEDLNDEDLASVEDAEDESLSLDDNTEESFLAIDDEAEESFVRDDIEVRDDDDEAADTLTPAWSITTPRRPVSRRPNITEAVTSSRNLTRRDSPRNWSALREAAWRWGMKGEGDPEAIRQGFNNYYASLWNVTRAAEIMEQRKAAAAAAKANATAPTNITAPAAANVTTRGDCNCSGGGSKPPKGDVDPRSECGCSKDKDKDTGDKKPQDDD